MRDNRDGTTSPYGRFTPELGAIWKPILDALSAPQPAQNTDNTADGTVDGIVEPDPRSAGQRRHDALLEAGLRLLRSATLPDSGGAPVTVLAHLSETAAA